MRARGVDGTQGLSRRDLEIGEKQWWIELSQKREGYTREVGEAPIHLKEEVLKLVEARLSQEEPINETLPAVLQRLYQLASDPEVSAPEMAKAASMDPALTGRLISLANSAFYRRDIEVDSLNGAICRVGVSAIRTMVLLPALKAKLIRDEGSQRLWEHARAVSAACPFLAGLAGLKPDVAFLAGLLHDVGRIMIWLETKELRARHGDALDAVSHVLHETYGQKLVARWCLPEEVVHAAGHHHTPDPEDLSTPNRVAHVVCIADVLIHGHLAEIEADPAEIPSVGALELKPTPVRALAKRIPRLLQESSSF